MKRGAIWVLLFSATSLLGIDLEIPGFDDEKISIESVDCRCDESGLRLTSSKGAAFTVELSQIKCEKQTGKVPFQLRQNSQKDLLEIHYNRSTFGLTESSQGCGGTVEWNGKELSLLFSCSRLYDLKDSKSGYLDLKTKDPISCQIAQKR